MADKTRVRPFCNGSQHRDWLDRNCWRCIKYDAETPPKDCEIDAALGESMFGDGTISAEMAKRMGFTDPLTYSWDCPERREDTEADRAAHYREVVEAAGQAPLFGENGRG